MGSCAKFSIFVLMAIWFEGCGDLSNQVFCEGTGEIEGRAVLDDRPATEARLYIVGDQDIVTATQPDGFFAFTGVPAGPRSVIAEDGLGNGVRFETLVVKGRTTDVGTVSLKDNGRIEGVVETSDGRSPQNARVRSYGTPFSTTVDATGRFAFDDVPPGCYPLGASLEGYQSALDEVCLDGGETAPSTLVLVVTCRPEPEVCDGVDNDCDDQIDEGCTEGLVEPCGGAAELVCPEGKVCVDLPDDGCDPETGGIDCMGACVVPRILPCGGTAGLGCPEGRICADLPLDPCDPENGGVDCPGMCVVSRVEVCGFMGIIQHICTQGWFCVDIPGDGCDPESGGVVCMGVCVEPEIRICGGVGLTCPVGEICADLPGDGCSPDHGGIDCPGICVEDQ